MDEYKKHTLEILKKIDEYYKVKPEKGEKAKRDRKIEGVYFWILVALIFFCVAFALAAWLPWLSPVKYHLMMISLFVLILGFTVYLTGVIWSLTQMRSQVFNPTSDRLMSVRNQLSSDLALYTELCTYDLGSLKLAKSRLELERKKMNSKLVFFGVPKKQTSVIGIVAAGYLLVKNFDEIDFHSIHFGLIGLALLLGLCIGGLCLKTVYNKFDLYVSTIDMAIVMIENKAEDKAEK